MSESTLMEQLMAFPSIEHRVNFQITRLVDCALLLHEVNRAASWPEPLTLPQTLGLSCQIISLSQKVCVPRVTMGFDKLFYLSNSA